MLDGVSDRERYIESLELIRTLDFVLVVLLSSGCRSLGAAARRATAMAMAASAEPTARARNTAS